MDQAQTGPNGHVQHPHNSHGSTFSNFIEGHQSFTDDSFALSGDGGNAEFDLSWNPELFQPPSTNYPHQSPSPVPGFEHNARHQHSSTPNYAGIQPTLSPGPFNQSQSYDNRTMNHQPYDQRSLSRVLPSPSYPFQPQNFQQTSGYPGREQLLSPSQFHRPVSNASMMLGVSPQQSPSASMASNYPPQNSHNIYQNMDPRQMHRSPLSGAELSQYNAFNEQHQQPTNQFISPQMLTNSHLRGGSSYPQSMPSQHPNSHLTGSVSPYMHSIYGGGDMRQYQTTQSFQQSIAPAYTMQSLQSEIPASGPSTSTFQGVFPPPKAIKAKAPKDPNAPKKVRGRPRKDGSILKTKKEGDVSSSEDSGSDDELQVEDPEPELTPAPLTLAPPTELKAKALYDAVLAVWSPRNLPANVEKVKKGGQLYSDTIRKLRDAWKPDNEALTAAENANNAAKATMLKEKVEAYRETLKKILDRTDQYGHPTHLRHIPLYPFTLSAFNSFLVDRIKRDDYEAPLVTSMMKAFTRFDTMTEEQLEQSKLIKLIQRVAKKSNAETKVLAQKVLDNAAAATKATKAKVDNDASPESPRPSNGLSSSASRSDPGTILPQKNDTVAGVKRSREGELSSLPATKKPPVKPIPQASKPLAVQQAEKRKAELAKQSAAKIDKPSLGSASSAPVPRPKVVVAPQKPVTTSVFAGLMSASKKPGTTMAEKAAAAAKAKPVTTTTSANKESSPQPSVAVAAAKPAFSFLDALQGMDKPKEVEKKKDEVRPNETEEERKKRLRKEERGKLRVSWADKLTEVRLFTHDPEEEVGHADSMMRDVDDVGGEGRMLKLHLSDEDLEDDEGEELDTYENPSEVDFSEVDWEERKTHFVKTGGPEMPESKSSEVQRLHEDSTIMVVFALPSDQPTSPKEPPESEDDDYEPDLSSPFGEPPKSVRERERRWLSARPPERAGIVQPGALDISTMLRNMQQSQTTPQPQIPPELQRTLALLGQQQQQQQQQQPQPPPYQPQQAAAPPDLSSIMAAVNQVKSIQQAQSTSSTAYSQPSAAPVAPNVAAIMLALQNAQNPQGLPVGSHNNPNPYPGPDNDYSRKHARNDSGADDIDGKKTKKKKSGGDVPYNYKTMVCSFWQQGKCMKGDNCTYRHSE